VYELDAPATLERMKQAGVEKTLAEVATVQVRLELKADGTFVSRATAGNDVFSAAGRWRTSLDQITLETLEENGQKRDPPDEKTGTYRDGALHFDVTETTQPIVLRKR
jgi:hypothetical protein